MVPTARVSRRVFSVLPVVVFIGWCAWLAGQAPDKKLGTSLTISTVTGQSVVVESGFKLISPRNDNSILIAPLGRVTAYKPGVLVGYKDDSIDKGLCSEQRDCMLTIHYVNESDGGDAGKMYLFHAASHRNLVMLLPSGKFESDDTAPSSRYVEHGVRISSVDEDGVEVLKSDGVAQLSINYVVAKTGK